MHSAGSCHLSTSWMVSILAARGLSTLMQMIFQSSSPPSIIAYAPRNLTWYTPPLCMGLPLISTTSTGSLSPCSGRMDHHPPTP